MIKKILYSIGIAAIAVIFLSCSNLQEIKIGDIRNVGFKGLNNNIVTLSLTIPIENPNPFKIKVSGSDLVVLIGNKEIGKVKKIDDIVIPRKSKKDYTINVSIEINDIKDMMTSAYQIYSGGMADARLAGTVKVKSFLYRKTFRVEDFPLTR